VFHQYLGIVVYDAKSTYLAGIYNHK